MNSELFVLHLINYGVLYSLPVVFFRQEGKLNLRWWLTCTPFGTSNLLLITGYLGFTPSMVLGYPEVARALQIASVPFALSACALVAATLATHHRRLALWHQDNDAPEGIVTHGPYRFVRHPFYVAFLLMLTGTTLATQRPGTAACLGVAIAVLTLTASREERRLLASSFGGEYATYLSRTGRFVPRLSGRSRGEPPAGPQSRASAGASLART